ncbi:MAG TPA: hypothetical protein VFA74_05905, partial [Terriglobales bacterium]|nr:hypothetical protein [Terriglobales bacterium]
MPARLQGGALPATEMNTVAAKAIPPSSPESHSVTFAFGIAALITGIKLLIHLSLSARYGYFRDEL